MHAKFLFAACATLILVAGGGTAAAAPCAGFTDVDDTNAICPNVEWLKNRSITTGCGAGLYCPNNPVIRLDMAAFMNRLGLALTPVEMTPASETPALRVLAANPVICQTAGFDVTGFPRRAYVNGAAHLSVPTANVDVVAQAVFSTNGGFSWSPIPNSDHFATLYTGASPGNHVTLAPFGHVDLNVGQSVRFGVQLMQVVGSGNVTAGCHTAVRIGNRNAATSPLDPTIARSRSGS